MTVHIVMKTYFATKFYAAHAVVLEVFDSYQKAFDFGEIYVDSNEGFDTEYTIDICTRDVK